MVNTCTQVYFLIYLHMKYSQISGVSEICIPQENEPHAKELPKLVRKGLKIHKYDHIDALLRKLFSQKRKKV